MQKEHIFQSQPDNQASVTRMKIPTESQAEELFGTTMWPSTPTFAATQPDKVLFCIFKRPSYCVKLIQLSFSKCERGITDFCPSCQSTMLSAMSSPKEVTQHARYKVFPEVSPQTGL